MNDPDDTLTPAGDRDRSEGVPFDAYYRPLARAVLAPRHLGALRRWLAGDYPPLAACRPPDAAFPRRPAEAWLHCFGRVSVGRRGAARGAAEPVALYKALLAHPWCAANLCALAEGRLGGPDSGYQPGAWGTVTLFGLFARVPQGARLIQKCALELGYFAPGGGPPAGDAYGYCEWGCRRDTFGDYLEEHLVGKALRGATLKDVKRLLALGAHLPGRGPLRPNWHAAALSPRRDVFEFAFGRAASAPGWCPSQWLAVLWGAAGFGGARVDLVIEAVQAPTAARALARCTGGPAAGQGFALRAARAYAGRARGPYFGLDAFFGVGYATLRSAREFAALLLEPGWAAAWSRAPLPGHGAPLGLSGPGVGSWAVEGDLLPCCVRPSCPRHQFNRGLHALTTGPEFEALELWEQTALVEKLAAIHLCGTSPAQRFADDACLWAFVDQAPRASRRRVTAMALRWGGLRVLSSSRGLVHRARAPSRGRPFLEPGRLLLFLCRAGLGGALAVALALSAPVSEEVGEVGALRFAASRYAVGLAGLRALVRGALDRRAFGSWRRTAGAVGREIALLPPAPRACASGGTAYRAGLRSFTGARFRAPPAHASPELLAWYLAQPATLSPKADGATYEGPLPPGIFPSLRAPWAAGAAVRAEVLTLQGATVYLVFDLLAPDYVDDTLLERMALARDAYPAPVPEPTGKTAEGALASLAAERAGLAEMLALAGPGAVVWWPKWVAPLPREGCLELLAGSPGALYPTDGWVLTPLASHAELAGKGAAGPPDIKVKPAAEMTADLEVLREGRREVWRCAWDALAGAWEPREARPEKRLPNPPELVAFLAAYHRAPWGPRDLAPYLGAGHYARARGGSPFLSAATRAFLREQRALQAARVGAACQGRRVLDVGAGRGRLAARCAGAARWTGLDTDPVCVVDARLCPATRGKGEWLWCDAGTLAPPLGAPPRGLAPAAFDLILCVHSIHHGAASEETWQAWVANLTSLAAPGAVLLVRTIDPAQLPAAPVCLPDGSFVRRLAGAAFVGATAVRSSLAWAASAADPVTEQYLDLGLLAGSLRAAGWDCLEVARQGETASEPWSVWALSHVWLVFGLSACFCAAKLNRRPDRHPAMKNATKRLYRQHSAEAAQLLGTLFDWSPRRRPVTSPAPAPALRAPPNPPGPLAPPAPPYTDDFIEANTPRSESASWGDSLDAYPEPAARPRRMVIVLAPPLPHVDRRGEKRALPPCLDERSEESGAESRSGRLRPGVTANTPAGVTASTARLRRQECEPEYKYESPSESFLEWGRTRGGENGTLGSGSYDEPSNSASDDSFPYFIPDWEAINELRADAEYYWEQGLMLAGDWARLRESSSEAPVDDV